MTSKETNPHHAGVDAPARDRADALTSSAPHADAPESDAIRDDAFASHAASDPARDDAFGHDAAHAGSNDLFASQKDRGARDDATAPKQ